MSAPWNPDQGNFSPTELAAHWAGEEGLVFFDTSGNVPAAAANSVSLIAVRPIKVLSGSIHQEEDREKLRKADGHLCGWVDYEGGYVFGMYPEVTIFDHLHGTWAGPHLKTKDRPVISGDVRISGLRPMTTRREFLSAVERAKEFIAAGDIYQVNLSQAFEAEISGGSLFPLYAALRELSPAPMAAWLALDGKEVLCSSPELFLSIRGKRIETRPIKGTRPRFADEEQDRAAARELQASAKERAELVMITDLLRNDLGQVCEYGSIAVEAALELETLAQVHHLVSTVAGTMRDDVDAIDALAACFPGGSITGAPKKRAMEIIHELEGRPRGMYCGAIGWIGKNGDATFNIAIRTLVREGNRLAYQVGAGIVADSEAEMEYEETLHKAAGIRLALERFGTRV